MDPPLGIGSLWVWIPLAVGIGSLWVWIPLAVRKVCGDASHVRAGVGERPKFGILRLRLVR